MIKWKQNTVWLALILSLALDNGCKEETTQNAYFYLNSYVKLKFFEKISKKCSFWNCKNVLSIDEHSG